MLPEDTDGILACTQEHIHSEVLDNPNLEMYLPMLTISSTVIPIAWDFNNRTFDFLGDDNTRHLLIQLHKPLTDSPKATHT